MGKVSKNRRRFIIQKKEKRRKKLRKLREKYFLTKSKTEKEKIIETLRNSFPHIPVEKYLKD